MICLDLVHAENDLQLDGFKGEMGRHWVTPKNKPMENKKIVGRNSEKRKK
jgi:hypothetical protein